MSDEPIIFYTAPYDDQGIVVARLVKDGSWPSIRLRACPDAIISGVKEGILWHRDRNNAVKKAREYRAIRIAKARDDLDKLLSLPEIA